MLYGGRALSKTIKHQIIRLLAHDTMFVSFSTGVETENGSCGTEILQEGPTAAGCGHEIGWIGVTAEEFR